jgi:hypothetical protein
MVARWRDLAREAGLPGIFIMQILNGLWGGYNNSIPPFVDGAIEFQV